MKKKILVVLSVVLIFLVGIYYYVSSNQIYGNDKESIQAIIINQKKTNDEVKVFSLIDIDVFRIAGYFEGDSELGGKMCYAVFKANKYGDYVIQRLFRDLVGESAGNKILYDTVSLTKDDKTPTNIYDIILSNNPSLAKVKRIINGSTIDTEIINISPSITLMIRPNLDSYSAQIFYYDANGYLLQ